MTVMLEAYIIRAPQSTTTIAYFGFSVAFCILLFPFFFFSIITNILENVLSPKNKSTAHHSVCLAFFTLCYCVQLPLQRCGSLAFSSALVELTEHT